MDPARSEPEPRAAPRVTRRTLLRAAGLGALAAGLAACAPAGPTPSAAALATASQPPSSPHTPAPSPAGSTPGPRSTPRPSVPPTLETMVAGLLVVGFRGQSLDDAPWVRAALDAGLGGVVLFDRDGRTGKARNVHTPAQVRALTAALRDAAGARSLLIAVDQEGGKVTRLSPAHGYPAVASEAEIGRGTQKTARRWARDLATTLAGAGVTLNLAPVVDLDVNRSSPAIGALGRSFSADPDVVVAMAGIELDAHRAAGVLATLKHFPGIGSSTANTDFGVADVTDTWTRRELDPFRRLIDAGTADAIMAGHVVNRRLDPDNPASLSPAVVTDLLRGELGWEGVVITDDLGAAAIVERYGADEAVLLALEAGNDLLLFANQQAYDPGVVARTVATVTGAVGSGRLDEARIEASWRRVRALLGGG